MELSCLCKLIVEQPSFQWSQVYWILPSPAQNCSFMLHPPSFFVQNPSQLRYSYSSRLTRVLSHWPPLCLSRFWHFLHLLPLRSFHSYSFRSLRWWDSIAPALWNPFWLFSAHVLWLMSDSNSRRYLRVCHIRIQKINNLEISFKFLMSLGISLEISPEGMIFSLILS